MNDTERLLNSPDFAKLFGQPSKIEAFFKKHMPDDGWLGGSGDAAAIVFDDRFAATMKMSKKDAKIVNEIVGMSMRADFMVLEAARALKKPGTRAEDARLLARELRDLRRDLLPFKGIYDAWLLFHSKSMALQMELREFADAFEDALFSLGVEQALVEAEIAAEGGH